ncbi:uncharacterized protein METZ01_LOCUS332008, partial [marine metagenome]
IWSSTAHPICCTSCTARRATASTPEARSASPPCPRALQSRWRPSLRLKV